MGACTALRRLRPVGGRDKAAGMHALQTEMVLRQGLPEGRLEGPQEELRIKIPGLKVLKPWTEMAVFMACLMADRNPLTSWVGEGDKP